MLNAPPQQSGSPPDSAEQPEPDDNRLYLKISIGYLVCVAVLVGVFILMLILLASSH
ncbi:MAG TPA: hypothetical protein VH540_20425 [Ktedonobacterales bacterium]